MDFGLRGKYALVAGGGRGIGKSIARELAREGVDVAIASRTLPELESTARELADETGQRIIPLALDVTKRDQVDRVVAEAAERLGGLHILVNSAALPGGSSTASGPVEAVNDDDLLWDFDVKYVGALRCARAAIPFLKEQGWGRIVNISGAQWPERGQPQRRGPQRVLGAPYKDAFHSVGQLRHHRQLRLSGHHPHRAHSRRAGGTRRSSRHLTRGDGAAGLLPRLPSQ